MRAIGMGAAALTFALVLAALPAIAGGALPPTGSTAPSDDLTVPAFGPAVSPADGLTWLEGALAVRVTEVTALGTAITASTTLPVAVRTSATNLVTTTAQSLASLTSSAPSDTTIRQVRQDAATTIGLHVFAVLEPQITDIVGAESIHAAAVQLLNQEVSIRAALAAAKTAGIPVASASARLAIFHNDLVRAKKLVDPLVVTLFTLGGRTLVGSTTRLATASAAEVSATALVAQARVAEQAIAASLTAKLRAKVRDR